MGHVQKRTRNGTITWRARYVTPDGKERSKEFKRRTDAERFLTALEASKHAGAFVDPALAKVKLASWAQTWLAGQAHLKPTTHERYRGIIDKHIEPVWGHVELGRVTHADVQTWVTNLAKGQSASSVRKIHRVLSLMLDLAIVDGRLTRNVARGIKLPQVVKPEKRYLSHTQVAALAEEAGRPTAPSKYLPVAERENATNRLVVLFLAYTGVRWGEMAALRVHRLDLKRRRAVIAESVTPLQGHGLVWGTPKNKKTREVPIPKFLAAELASHVRGKDRTDLVFVGVRGGEVMRVATFQRVLDRAGAQLGLKGFHPHEFRHTAASLAIAAGADIKVVQEMLGHATATMTMDTYGHLFKSRLDVVSEALDAARHAELTEESETGGEDLSDRERE